MAEDVELDPRLNERRQAVRRATERRRLRVALILLSVPAAIAAILLLLRSAVFDVDAVRVVGAHHVSVGEVRSAAGVDRGDPLAFVDTSATARRVERLAWVGTASASREWPGTLRIMVSELHPTAFVRRPGGGVMLVAGDGHVLGEADQPGAGAVEILGVRRLPSPGETLVPAGAAGVVARMPESLARRVVAVDLAHAGVSLRLLPGPEIRLGDLDDLAAKGAAAEAVLERLGTEQAAYVDVSVPAAPVVGDAAGVVAP